MATKNEVITHKRIFCDKVILIKTIINIIIKISYMELELVFDFLQLCYDLSVFLPKQWWVNFRNNVSVKSNRLINKSTNLYLFVHDIISTVMIISNYLSRYLISVLDDINDWRLARSIIEKRWLMISITKDGLALIVTTIIHN